MANPAQNVRALARGLVQALPDGAAALAAEAQLSALAKVTPGELFKTLSNPGLDLATRRAIAEAVCDKLETGAEVKALYAILVERDELRALPMLPRAVARQREARFGLAVVEVRAARALSETQKSELAAAFAKKTGRQIVIRETVDAALLAGAVATVGSEVFDASLTGLLAAAGRGAAA